GRGAPPRRGRCAEWMRPARRTDRRGGIPAAHRPCRRPPGHSARSNPFPRTGDHRTGSFGGPDTGSTADKGPRAFPDPEPAVAAGGGGEGLRCPADRHAAGAAARRGGGCLRGSLDARRHRSAADPVDPCHRPSRRRAHRGPEHGTRVRPAPAQRGARGGNHRQRRRGVPAHPEGGNTGRRRGRAGGALRRGPGGGGLGHRRPRRRRRPAEGLRGVPGNAAQREGRHALHPAFGRVRARTAGRQDGHPGHRARRTDAPGADKYQRLRTRDPHLGGGRILRLGHPSGRHAPSFSAAGRFAL
ncbi:MAG: hypothetical protein AVDCRST_MAG83-2215, partial [uncultured Arthrobacter sp.]